MFFEQVGPTYLAAQSVNQLPAHLDHLEDRSTFSAALEGKSAQCLWQHPPDVRRVAIATNYIGGLMPSFST
jgi:hypothetical protein